MFPGESKKLDALGVLVAHWCGVRRPEFGAVLAKLLMNEFFGMLAAEKWTLAEVTEYREDLAGALGEVAALKAGGVITGKQAKELLGAVWAIPYRSVLTCVVEMGMLEEAGGKELLGIVGEVVATEAAAVEKVRAGKTQVMGFLVGQVMKRVGGKADPVEVRRMLEGIVVK